MREHRRCVALHPTKPWTGERRATVAAPECILVHAPDRAGVRRGDPGPRCERRIIGRSGEAHIPRADVLADVAAEHPVPHLLALGRSELAVVLDREVRDARAGVEIAGPDERLRRTGVKTARARAAPIGFERRIGLDVRVSQHNADERERADLRTNEHHVLADPAQARELRELTLGNWTGIDVTAGLGARSQEPDRRGELLETLV